MRASCKALGNKLVRFRKSENGIAAVEFGLVAVPFLAVILASLQVLTIFVAQEVLETVADAASRQILTGKAQMQGVTQAQFQALICANVPALLQCNNIISDIQVASSFSSANTSAPTLTYNSNGAVSNPWQYNLGAQGQIIVMRLIYQWHVFNFHLPLSTNSNGTRLLMATRVFRNETYQ